MPKTDKKKWLKMLAIVLGLYFLANMAYFIKSAAGIDLDPGRHHGGIFPLGDMLFRWWTSSVKHS